MKKILLLFCAFILVQGAAAQKMILHMKNQGPIEVQLSNVDSITFTITSMGDGLFSNPPSVYVDVGSSMFATISGGIAPYMIEQFPESNIATAMIQGNTVTIQGMGIGSTVMKVKDNSIPAKFVMIFITVAGGPGGLNANPPYLEMKNNEQATSIIGGGTEPYMIQVPPDPQIATATIQGNTLTVTGLGNGYTKIVVKDNSMPVKTVQIDVRVRIPFTVPGTMSLTSTVKNFSANGIFINADSLPSNTQGVGGFFMTYNGHSELVVIGYYKNTNTDWDIVMLAVGDTGAVGQGTFKINDSLSMKHALCYYVVGWNPDSGSGGDDMFENGYRLMTGSVAITSFSAGNAQGTFSGMGTKLFNGNPMPAFPITISNGMFNAPLLMGEPAASHDRPALNRLLRMVK